MRPNWKDLYKDKWEEGNSRERMVVEFLENLGYQVYASGFEALSGKYNPNQPKEKGVPDLYIMKEDRKVFFEVTGTNNMNPMDNIWIRPDKINYAKTKNLAVYFVHIISSIPLMRFIYVNNIKTGNIIKPIIRGQVETYVSIPPEDFTSENLFAVKVRNANS
jgi:hypothetical protein